MKNLFSKYQKLLLSFANHSVGKRYLNLPNEKITRILPNGYEWQISKDLVRGRIYPGNLMADKLGLAVTALDITSLKNIRSLLYYLGLAQRPFYAPLIHFTTLDVAAGAGSIRKTDATWATARGSASGNAPDVNLNSVDIHSSVFGGSNYIDRVYLPFDTSTIDSILSASLNFYENETALAFDNDTVGATIALTLSTQASLTTLDAADFSAITLNSPAEGATRLAFSAISLNALNTMALNATGLSWITTSLKLCLRTSLDVDNSAPTAPTSINCFGVESYNDPHKPYLDYLSSGGTMAAFEI